MKLTSSKASTVKKTKKAKHPTVKFITLVLKISLLIILATSFIIGGVLTGAVIGYIKSAPPITKDQLSMTITNSFVYDESGKNIIGELRGSENRVIVSHDEIPDNMRNAFIAIEDERFYSHNGMDMKRFIGAALSWLTSFGHADYGGSTITQQLVKNITGNDRDSVPRKIQEAWQAMQLEKLVNSKEDILDNYMNRITTGVNSYGVQTAAKKYFGKNVKDLTLAQCASIAGITKNPSKYSPVTARGKENNITRQRVILSKMYSLGMISEEQYNEAMSEKITFLNKSTASKSYVFSYFVDKVLDDVIADLAAKKNITKNAATLDIYNHGYKIISTMDQNAQKAMDKVFTNETYFPSPIVNGEHPQASMVLMDPNTGEVKALYGGYGVKKASRILNRATQTHRQAGSSFKPIAVYAPAIDTGLITAATVVDDVPMHLNSQNKSAIYPKNFTGTYAGLTTIRKAIAASVNVVAAKTWLKLGADTSLKYLKDNGIELDPQKDGNLSIALGGLTDGVNPLQMAAAYSPLATDGQYKEPITYSKVLDKEGNVILEKKYSQKKQVVFKEQTAFVMTQMMKDTCNSYSGTAYYGNWRFPGEILGQLQGGKMPTAGKTGTTSSDKDRWFMGYTPYYVGAVWYGYDTPTEVHLSSSYNPSLIIWHAVMNEVHKNLKPIPFPTPTGIVKKTICIDSGKLATSLCYKDPRGPRVREEYFIKGTEPQEGDVCEVHVTADVCKSSKDGLGRYPLKTSSCPSSTVLSKVFIQRLIPFVKTFSSDPTPLDWKYEVPTAHCKVHSGGASQGEPEALNPSKPKNPATYVSKAEPLNTPEPTTEPTEEKSTDNNSNTTSATSEPQNNGDIIAPEDNNSNPESGDPIITP